MATVSRWPWIAPIVFYTVTALEMIIMISPAAAYFYSVYTPLFHSLEQFQATAWLPQFFLPHLAHTQWPLFRWLSWLGAALTLIGLIGFLVCAVQLYYGKLIRKRLVSGGLYGRVRHPQYLLLIVAGAGLLLLWPRFFILVSYLLMLGLYYALARHEEELVRARYGQPAEEYMAKVPMFNPLRRPAPTATWQPLRRRTALAIWLGTTLAVLGVAFALRAIAVEQLYLVRLEAPEVTALSLRPRTDAEIRELTGSVLDSEPVRAWTTQQPATPLFLQIGSGLSMLKHVLIDLGMTDESIQALELLEDSDFAVLSEVFARPGAPANRRDPLSLRTRIEPRFLAQFGDDGQTVLITELAPEKFYPGFSRIIF